VLSSPVPKLEVSKTKAGASLSLTQTLLVSVPLSKFRTAFVAVQHSSLFTVIGFESCAQSDSVESVITQAKNSPLPPSVD